MKKLKIILIFIPLLFLIISCEKDIKYYNVPVHQNILSLKLSKNIEGSFVLGSGNINEVDYYYFFIKDTVFNGYKKHKVRALSTLLIEKDTVPHLIHNRIKKQTKTKVIFKEEELSEELLDYGLLLSLTDGITLSEEIKYKYILVIPKGTITENVSWGAL